ncbi:MAG: response regulator [Nitrospirae bacterium]|nr:response regulator [Nitrospirota bacterium]MCL5976841.1 response regulator [Nitrospirota bacterium]
MSEDIKASVLVVDDEEQFLDVFSKRLEGRGLKVDKAVSGEEALNRVKGKDFDTIILDMMMPGISGLDTLKKLKEENPDAQIIILTGHATVEKGVEAIKAGAVDFLEKPVDINKLLEKIGDAQHKRMIIVEKKSEEAVKELLKTKGW